MPTIKLRAMNQPLVFDLPKRTPATVLAELPGAVRHVENYLRSMGGLNNGHTFAWPERQLAIALARELAARARAAARAPVATVRRARSRSRP